MYDDERAVLQSLSREIAALDERTRLALAQALERGEARLEGGTWGSRYAGAGCLLSLAAWELGLDGGEDLLPESIAAVRIPALFDHLWALVLERVGAPREARRIAHRLVARALSDPASSLLAEMPKQLA